MVIYGYIWLYMFFYGYIWLYMVIYGYIWFFMVIYGYIWLYMVLNGYIWLYTSSTAQGGGGSFKNRKPIGEVGCCESGMAKRIH